MDRRVVLDTNVFVAAGFNGRSRSAQVLALLHEGRLSFVWNEATRDETEHILRKIPPLEWKWFEALFDETSRYDGSDDVSDFDFIPDRDDRNFAELAHAVNAVLVTMDDDLLSVRSNTRVRILSPAELVKLNGQ